MADLLPSSPNNTIVQLHFTSVDRFLGYLTIAVSVCVFLAFSALALTATVVALVFFAPLLIISSPIWVPVGVVLFAGIAGLLSAFGMGVAAVAGVAWLYRNLNVNVGGGVDYARSRIADTAGHVRDYAREHGLYRPAKVKDAAPGA